MFNIQTKIIGRLHFSCSAWSPLPPLHKLGFLIHLKIFLVKPESIFWLSMKGVNKYILVNTLQ